MATLLNTQAQQPRNPVSSKRNANHSAQLCIDSWTLDMVTFKLARFEVGVIYHLLHRFQQDCAPAFQAARAFKQCVQSLAHARAWQLASTVSVLWVHWPLSHTADVDIIA